jgi:metal-dependent HD superfamily phosphatase/phosphodiesterase
MSEDMMTIRAKHRETGATLAVSINDEFLKKLHEDGREDLVLITETLINGERRIQYERAFIIAALVAVRDLCERGSHDTIKAYANTLSTMLMERYKGEILTIIGDEGMQRAAFEVSEILGAVIATMNAAAPASTKPETEH